MEFLPELSQLFINTLIMGGIYSLVVLALFLTSQLIVFDDLSIEGSFASGGALCALMLTWYVPPIVCIPFIMAAGALVGITTGTIHNKLRCSPLISGIIVITGLFSINLNLAGPNLSLANYTTIFDQTWLASITSNAELQALIIITLINVIVMCGIEYFLRTELGFLLTAVGQNPRFLTNLGKNSGGYKLVALMIAHSVTALAGSLFVQYNGFFSITGSIGTLIIGLAGLMIGEKVIAHSTLRFILGAIIYQAVIALTIQLEFNPSWNKLVTALLLAALMFVQHRKLGRGA
ncbi:MAG: hypothetical protein H6679_05910 [Epsilonproteobacteria bacterium]|nr:hypothetical protein [Campylobacterota bacterium]